MPTLSLCLIVKDEERFLPDCLASARGIADEVVVVDTGSADRTPEVAERAGAKLVRFAWRDDFAAARNAGLEAARGTHVLVLDADERLAGDAKPALARALRDRELAVGMLPLSDADALEAAPEDVLSGARRLAGPTWLPRFFVNHRALRFRRRVHETVFARDVEAQLAEAGGRIAPVDAPIVHYGEVRALRAEREKRARNTRLCELALAEDPADGDLAGYLAAELARAGERERAREVAERHLGPFLAALDACAPGALKPSPIQLATVLGTLELERGDAARALEVARAAAARCPAAHPDLVFLEGLALERLGEAQAAAERYEACLALDGERLTIPARPGVTREAPRLRLANLLLAHDQPNEALVFLEGVEGRYAPAAELARAEALLALGRPGEALALLAPSLTRPDPPPDLFALASWASAELGAGDPAFAEASRAAQPERWWEPRRRALVR